MESNKRPKQIGAISELHSLLNLNKPLHPLISVINLADIEPAPDYVEQVLAYPFYCISLIKNKNTESQYGKQNCDFDTSVMTFAAPRQLVNVSTKCTMNSDGYLLIINPDFLHSYSVANKIKNYGFFSYSAKEALHLSTKEALHLSTKENEVIISIFKNIENEINSSIDTLSQDIIVSHIELLLSYTNRFYNRQFIIRKSSKNELFDKLNTLLKNYFDSDEIANYGLPSVQCIAAELNISPNYLSDTLKIHTGLSAKQHIQDQLIEKAKELLATTNMTVAEIAYQLGFGYPQSFNKIFKSKTNFSPNKFRHSIN